MCEICSSEDRPPIDEAQTRQLQAILNDIELSRRVKRVELRLAKKKARQSILRFIFFVLHIVIVVGSVILLIDTVRMLHLHHL